MTRIRMSGMTWRDASTTVVGDACRDPPHAQSCDQGFKIAYTVL
jgi:hypothetical protein